MSLILVILNFIFFFYPLFNLVSQSHSRRLTKGKFSQFSITLILILLFVSSRSILLIYIFGTSGYLNSLEINTNALFYNLAIVGSDILYWKLMSKYKTSEDPLFRRSFFSLLEILLLPAIHLAGVVVSHYFSLVVLH